MMNGIGKKIGMAMLGGSLALLIPFTAAAQDRDDHRFDRGFDRDRHEVQVRQEPVRVVRRREVRGRAYEQGFLNGYRNRVSNGYSNGYYDSFGNWCAR